MAVAELPPVLSPHLSPIEVSWRQQVLLRGGGAVIGTLAGGLAAVLIADAFLNLGPVWRWSGLLLSISGSVFALWLRVVRPLFRGMTLADAAEWLERSHPELQERLRTCLDLEATSADPPSRAALLMRRQVRKETLSLLNDIPLDDALPPQRAFRTGGLGLLAVAVLIAPFGLWTTGYGLEWQRVFQPWGNHGWGRNWLVTGAPGDQMHPRGHDLAVAATAIHRRQPDQVAEHLTLHWRAVGTREWDERRLTREETSGQFAAVLPRLSADTEWYVTGPASASPRYRVTAVDPPRIVQFTADVDPLPYTGAASQHADVLNELSAPIGSSIQFQVLFDRPVSGVDLHWPVLETAGAVSMTAESAATVAARVSAEGLSATVRVRGERSGPFHLAFHSPAGLTVTDESRRLVILPDVPPSVKLDGGPSITVRPDDRVTLRVTATDDFGLQAAELQLAIGEHDVRTQSLPVAASLDGWQWSPVLEVSEFGLASGQAATVRVRVVDNREWPSPQVAWSEPQVVVISASAPTAAERALMEQTNAARHDLQELLRELAEQREQLRDLHQKTAAATIKQRDADQAARLTELAAKQTDLTEQLKNWQSDLPESAPWQPIRAAAQDVLDGDLGRANAELAESQKAEPREQIEHLSRALDELAAAQRELRRIDDAIRALGQLGPELGELAQLANRSDRLADALERDARVTLEQQQTAEQLQRDLERAIADRPELKAAVEQALRDRAAATAQRANELADRQRQLAETIQGAEPTAVSENRPANADRPANAATTASPEFAGGRAATEQLQQAADQAVRTTESLLNALGPDAPPVENAIQAARALDAARDAAAHGRLSDAVQQAQQAQGSLQQAAAAFPAGAADTPAAQQTQQLAQQAAQAAEQLSAVANSADAQRGAQAAAQQQLAEATSSLTADPVTPNDAANGPAQSTLSAAEQAMQQTQSALQAGDDAQAAAEARQAAESLSQAAQQIQPASADSSPTTPSPAGESLTAAEQNLQSAQQQLAAASAPLPNATSAPPMPGETTPMNSPATQPPATPTAATPSPTGVQPPTNSGSVTPQHAESSPSGSPPMNQPSSGATPMGSQPGGRQPGAQQSPDQPASAPSTNPSPMGQPSSSPPASGSQPPTQANQPPTSGSPATSSSNPPSSSPSSNNQPFGESPPSQPANASPGSNPPPSGQPTGQPQPPSQQPPASEPPSTGQPPGSSPMPSSQPSQGQPGQGQPGQGQVGQGQASNTGSPVGQTSAGMPAASATSPSQPGSQAASGPSSVAGAASDLRRAGQALRQAVDQLTGQPQAPSPAAMFQAGSFRAPSGEAHGSEQPAELAAPGGQASLERLEQKLQAASQKNWGRLPGKLQTEILEGGRLPTHPDYARQIQKYFQTIAQPASAPPAEPKP